MKREIRSEEMEAIFRLAAKYPDLRTIERDLIEVADLRQRVTDLTKAAMGEADPVQPKSVSDLLKLEKAGYISHEDVASKLGLKKNPDERSAWWHAGGRIRWNGDKPAPD